MTNHDRILYILENKKRALVSFLFALGFLAVLLSGLWVAGWITYIRVIGGTLLIILGAVGISLSVMAMIEFVYGSGTRY